MDTGSPTSFNAQRSFGKWLLSGYEVQSTTTSIFRVVGQVRTPQSSHHWPRPAVDGLEGLRTLQNQIVLKTSWFQTNNTPATKSVNFWDCKSKYDGVDVPPAQLVVNSGASGACDASQPHDTSTRISQDGRVPNISKQPPSDWTEQPHERMWTDPGWYPWWLVKVSDETLRIVVKRKNTMTIGGRTQGDNLRVLMLEQLHVERFGIVKMMSMTRLL